MRLGVGDNTNTEGHPTRNSLSCLWLHWRTAVGGGAGGEERRHGGRAARPRGEPLVAELLEPPAVAGEIFDEDFFLYYEELDFTRRAHALGVRTRYVPSSRVVHLVGQSTGVTSRNKRPGRTPGYWFESRKRYFKKHHSALYKLLADAAFVLGRSIHHVLRVLRRRPNLEPPRYLWDFVRNNWLPGGRARSSWPR